MTRGHFCLCCVTVTQVQYCCRFLIAVGMKVCKIRWKHIVPVFKAGEFCCRVLSISVGKGHTKAGGMSYVRHVSVNTSIEFESYLYTRVDGLVTLLMWMLQTMRFIRRGLRNPPFSVRFFFALSNPSFCSGGRARQRSTGWSCRACFSATRSARSRRTSRCRRRPSPRSTTPSPSTSTQVTTPELRLPEPLGPVLSSVYL